MAMDNKMSPEEMSGMMEQSGKQPKGVVQLAQEVGKGLSELATMIGEAPGTTDKDMAQISGILNQFIDLVENKLAGAKPGEDVEEEGEPMPEQMSAMGGKGVPVGPNMRT